MQAKLEHTLAKLVTIPSVTTDAVACHEVIDFVRDELLPLDLHITNGPSDTPYPWFFATTQKTLRPDILLVAHLDVVPAPPELFLLQKKDGKLRGRGVYDMKLAAACYLEFFKAHAAKLAKLNIGVLFTTDEERGGASIERVLATGLKPNIIFIPDGGDNWHIEKRAKGLWGMTLTSHGRSAHGSRPWEGDNALHRLLDALAVLRQSFPSARPEDSTFAINQLEAGETFNQIPNFATAHIDFRSFSKEELHLFRAQVTQLAKKYSLEITILQDGDPLDFDESLPEARNFLEAYTTVLGKEPVFTESYGATDARHFAKHNIPAIIVEPVGGGRHAAGEWLDAASFVQYYQLIEHWLVHDAVHATHQKQHVSVKA